MIVWNKVTWYSKLLAVILFVGVIPAWTFYIGRQYEKTVEMIQAVNASAISAKLNQKILDNGVYITPLAVVSDSRCAQNVVCIQAGTVTLKVKIDNGTTSKEATLKIGDGTVFLGKTVVFADVLPAKDTRVTLHDSDYVFTFSVK